MKKVIILLQLMLFFSFLGNFSQACFPEGISFTAQWEVDSFAVNHPGCTEIEGGVIISDAITNLNGLSGITAIGGILQIGYAAALTSLNGLQNMTSIKELSIINTGLTSLNGLQNLTSLETLVLGGDPGNTSLTSLNGIQNVATLKSLQIQNTGLTSLNGLQNLTSLENLDLFGNSLTSLNGIQQLTSLKNLSIVATALTSLGGLQNLISVESLTIGSNPSLTSLNGLQNLTSLENLDLFGNPLTSLNGIQQLTSLKSLSIVATALTSLGDLQNLISVESLTIGNNPSLTSLSGLEHITSIQHLSIYGNATMTSLNGIQQIASLQSLNFSSPVLTSLDGLQNITSLDSLIIAGNTAMTSLSGLSNFTAMEDLSIIGNTALTSLSGLENIAFLEGLYIFNNYALTNLSGLENLTSLENLSIKHNSMLASLSGLENITSLEFLDITENPQLSSLTSLQNLASLKNLLLGYTALTDLSGLENLTSLEDLNLINNASLSSLSGLQNLTSLRVLNIKGNPSLTDLSGLQGVTSTREIVIQETGLNSLNGLDNVDSIGGSFTIQDNNSLVSLSALHSLTSIGRYMFIAYNPGLANLNGLENLVSIGGNPQFQGDTEDGYLWIYANEILSNLDGLQDLTSVKGMEIYNNPLLSDCAVFAVCNQLFNEPSRILIADNSPGCDTPLEVAAMCSSTAITVIVLLDDNGNQTPIENILVKLSGSAQMNLRPTDTSGIARFALLENIPIAQVLSLPEALADKWQRTESYQHLTSITGQDSIVATFLITPITQCPELTVDLGLPSFFRGCLVNSYMQGTTKNSGTALAEGVVMALVLPPVLEVVSSVPMPSAQNGDTLFFELGDMKVFETATASLTVKTKCDTFLIGQALCLETFATLDNACSHTPIAFSEIKLSAQCIGDTIVRFKLKNIGDAPTQAWHAYKIIRNEAIYADNGFQLAAQQSLSFDFPADGATWRMEATKFDDGTETAIALENCGGLTPGLINAFWLDHGPLEYDFDCRQVIGSFDPNLKTAVPTGAGPNHSIIANQPIQYTIDFQNTGSDTAYRVLLRDLLPSDFDLNTFRPGYSSHPCTWEIKGNTLEVLFSPIALPDSNVNEPASHGFFSFDIDQKPNLPEGSYFENTANIIFDFNPPIYTNYVWHYIGKLTVKVDEPQAHAALWQVLGNPTRDVATFQTMEEIAGEKQFDLYDAAGRLVRSAQFSGQAFEFQRDLLEAGVYFFRIVEAKGRVFSGRIVVAD